MSVLRSKARAALIGLLAAAAVPAAAQPARPVQGPPVPPTLAQAAPAPLPPRPADAAMPAAEIPRDGTLSLDAVLLRSREFQPQILEALARVRVAEGRRLSVEGAFDTLFSAKADTRVAGFYDGRYLESVVSQPLQNNGGSLYGGYRISGGDFPIYEDEKFTNQLGELKAGAVFALLRDRIIDERRFDRTLADGDIVLADAERLMIAIGVQARAVEAYNAWVVAGQRVRVFRDLLALSLERQRAFERAVATGLRPRIILTENEQNILRRQSFVAQAEQALAVAANNLSLFWRDADGRPLVPDIAQMPPDLPTPLPLPIDPRSGLLQRPDLRMIEVRLDLARQRLALDRNQLLPRLDVAVEVSRDFGDIGLGGISREGTESKLGLTFRFPLQNRAARGRLAQTEAEIDAFRRRGQALSEQIVAQIDAIGITIDAATRIARLAAEEADRAQTMAVAERRRFEMGAVDFFVVNLREEAAADAEVRRLDAAFRQLTAHAELVAATADTETLRLE